MKENRFFKMFVVMVFAVVIVQVAHRAGWADEPIRLGFIGPLSGDLSSYGIPALRGVELAIEDVNRMGGVRGRRVDLYVEDDLCIPKDASIRASKMVVNDVHAIVGHICSGATRAALFICRQAEIIAVSPSATHPELTQSGDFPNFFRTIASDDIQARVQIKFVIDVLNLKKVAVLHDMTIYGKGLAETSKAILQNTDRVELVFYDGILWLTRQQRRNDCPFFV